MDAVSGKEQELSDIELCYKAMGLSFSDNPDQVEKTYRKLKEEYSKSVRSTDLAVRATAQENLKQVEELFATITGSLIYKDYAREYEKYTSLKAEKRAERRQKQPPPAVTQSHRNCPYCNRPIASTLKVCIYCHGRIMTPMEELTAKLFSTRNLIIAAIAALLVISAIALMSNPELLKR